MSVYPLMAEKSTQLFYRALTAAFKYPGIELKQLKRLGRITKIWFRQFSDSKHFTFLALRTAADVDAS